MMTKSDAQGSFEHLETIVLHYPERVAYGTMQAEHYEQIARYTLSAFFVGG
jgi:hypothetical protein